MNRYFHPFYKVPYRADSFVRYPVRVAVKRRVYSERLCDVWLLTGCLLLGVSVASVVGASVRLVEVLR
jgi:hypothetical protein